MARAYVQQFIVDRVGNILGPDAIVGEENTRVFYSVVVDRDEFDALVDELLATGLLGFKSEHAVSLKEAGHIPLMKRGTKTEFVFERYGIKAELVSLIVGLFSGASADMDITP